MKTLAVLILLVTILRNNILATNKEATETVIIVPGLGDRDNLWLIKSSWNRQGVKLVPFETKWKSSESYSKKLDRLIELIETESKNKPVSLVGMSAGGSLVINAYNTRKIMVNKVIAVCARLKKGKEGGFRGFTARTSGYPAFAESVVAAEEVTRNLSEDDKKWIMTVRAMWGDELVPAETAIIDKARNITVPTIEHNISIMASLTVFVEKLTRFIIKD